MYKRQPPCPDETCPGSLGPICSVPCAVKDFTVDPTPEEQRLQHQCMQRDMANRLSSSPGPSHLPRPSHSRFLGPTRDLPVAISHWTVDTRYNGSDHNTVTFHIGLGFEYVPSTQLWDRADWTVFTDVLATTEFHSPHSMTTKKLDRLVSKLTCSINCALDQCCPRLLLTVGTPTTRGLPSGCGNSARVLSVSTRLNVGVQPRRTSLDSRPPRLATSMSADAVGLGELTWTGHLDHVRPVVS